MKQKKLYVLTGFLGAGKTDLLLHLLDNVKELKVGVIQNEFGKLSIDGLRVERDGIELVEISRGSICCSCLKRNFVQAVTQLGLDAAIEEVEDLMEIVKLGMMSVPAVIVDGKRIVSGRVPKTKELLKLLSQ